MFGECEPIRIGVDPGVLKLSGDAGSLVDLDEGVGDSNRRRKLVIPRDHVPIGINGEGVDRRTGKSRIGRQPVIDQSGIYGRSRSGRRVNRNQAMEACISDGGSGIQRLRCGVPGQPVYGKAHRADDRDQRAVGGINLDQRARLGAGTAESGVIARASRAKKNRRAGRRGLCVRLGSERRQDDRS